MDEKQAPAEAGSTSWIADPGIQTVVKFALIWLLFVASQRWNDAALGRFQWEGNHGLTGDGSPPGGLDEITAGFWGDAGFAPLGSGAAAAEIGALLVGVTAGLALCLVLYRGWKGTGKGNFLTRLTNALATAITLLALGVWPLLFGLNLLAVYFGFRMGRPL